jgi:hypothetical protein
MDKKNKLMTGARNFTHFMHIHLCAYLKSLSIQGDFIEGNKHEYDTSQDMYRFVQCFDLKRSLEMNPNFSYSCLLFTQYPIITTPPKDNIEPIPYDPVFIDFCLDFFASLPRNDRLALFQHWAMELRNFKDDTELQFAAKRTYMNYLQHEIRNRNLDLLKMLVSKKLEIPLWLAEVTNKAIISAVVVVS